MSSVGDYNLILCNYITVVNPRNTVILTFGGWLVHCLTKRGET